MKNRSIIFLLLLIFPLSLFPLEHPCLFVNEDDRSSVVSKIEKEEWANKAFDNIVNKIKKYVDIHEKDKNWIVSRMSMYWKKGERYTQCYLKSQNWDRGEGDAPVPTVRMPGMRTWNQYVNVPLEERTPYNETGDMWGKSKIDPDAPKVLVPYKESGHMIRSNNVEILSLAEDAAFVYWVTKDEKYARFATDIYNTWLLGTYYMNPILDPEKSCGSYGGWEPGGICGYYDYEQIHDDLAMHAATIYDFAYDFIVKNPHPQAIKIEKSTKELSDEVFKRFINLGLIRGDKNGNWNVNGWNMIIRPILVLGNDSEYVDGKGKQYYLNFLLNKSTDYRASIPDFITNYDNVTGLWPEAPGYAFSTIQMILEWASLLRNAGIDIIKEYPILNKAALAIFPWLDENFNLVVFGDTRGGSANFNMFEHLLSYYSSVDDKVNSYKIGSAIRKGIDFKKYERSNSGWVGICTFSAKLPISARYNTERASYSRFHRFITMKNFDSLNRNKLMACLYGGRKGSHLSPNGLAVQYYGWGFSLAPDASAYESYWSDDYMYHGRAIGSNTIPQGYNEGDIFINAMEPIIEEGSFINKNSLTPYINFSDVSAGDKRRTVLLVSSSDGNGYYVDIFRSKLYNNDYIFHNIGRKVNIKDFSGNLLNLQYCDSISSLGGISYKYFTKAFCSKINDGFIAEWNITDSINSRLWLTGVAERTLYKVDAPSTTLLKDLTPDGVSSSPMVTPSILVRQKGQNAVEEPFVGVYESFIGENYSISKIKGLRFNGSNVGVKIYHSNKIDYVISTDLNDKKYSDDFIKLSGSFGYVSTEGNEVSILYMGNSNKIIYGDVSMQSVKGKPIYASIYKLNGKTYYSSTGDIILKVNNNAMTLGKGYNIKLDVNL